MMIVTHSSKKALDFVYQICYIDYGSGFIENEVNGSLQGFFSQDTARLDHRVPIMHYVTLSPRSGPFLLWVIACLSSSLGTRSTFCHVYHPCSLVFFRVVHLLGDSFVILGAWCTPLLIQNAHAAFDSR